MHTLELSSVERGALMALVGLAISVMQNDRQRGEEFIQLLSSQGLESVCMALVERLSNDEERDNAPRH